MSKKFAAMTETATKHNYSRIINVLLIIGIAVVLVFLIRSCGNEKSASIAYENIKHRLQKVLDDSAKAKEIAKAKEEDIRQLDAALADSRANEDLMRQELINKSNKADRLEKQLQKAREDKDTVAIMALADTCCFENTMWRGIHKALVADKKLTDSLYTLRVKKADSLATHWHMEYIKCFSAVEFAAGELPKIKPKGQAYLTGGGFVAGPVFGVTGGITHISKKGLLVSGKGMLTNYRPGGMVEVGMPFSIFRKK